MLGGGGGLMLGEGISDLAVVSIAGTVGRPTWQVPCVEGSLSGSFYFPRLSRGLSYNNVRLKDLLPPAF